MTARPGISCLVFTLNEEVNLPHCLESLAWCDDVVVVDSYSTDRTEAVAGDHGARFVQNEFTGFGDQRNWALQDVPLRHPWALILDADERTTPQLVQEMEEQVQAVADDVAAFRVRRRFYLWGKWLRRSSLYPTWVVRLVRVGKVRYVNRGHAETQIVDGAVESLHNDLIDENHKGIDEWWARQIRYAAREAEYEMSQPAARFTHLFSRDPLRRRAAVKALARNLPARPLFYFLYCYLLRLGILDGVDGWRLSTMKSMCQAMICLKKREIARQGGSQELSQAGATVDGVPSKEPTARRKDAERP